MDTAAKLMDDVLSLPRPDRSYLAAKLIESLDRQDDISPEWMAELDRRVENWKADKSNAVTSEDLHQEIQNRLSN